MKMPHRGNQRFPHPPPAHSSATEGEGTRVQWELGELGEQSISVDVDNKAKVRLKLRAERGQSGDNKSKSTPLFKTPVELG